MSFDQALCVAIGALITVISVLCGVIAMFFNLYKQQFATVEARANKLEDRVSECDKDRRELWIQIASLQREAPPINPVPRAEKV